MSGPRELCCGKEPMGSSYTEVKVRCSNAQWNMAVRRSKRCVVRRTVRHPHPPTEVLLPFVCWLCGTSSPDTPPSACCLYERKLRNPGCENRARGSLVSVFPRLRSRMDLAALFIAGIACALVGWALVHISAQVEQRRDTEPHQCPTHPLGTRLKRKTCFPFESS